MIRPIEHILYTDDDHDDHYLFSEALKQVKPSATVHSFYSCSDILDYLKDENIVLPDIIFLDQNMHGNRNNECLKEIKRVARLENIPVVVYTTGGDPKLVGNAIELGAYKYIIKPVYHSETTKKLEEILRECENYPPLA